MFVQGCVSFLAGRMPSEGSITSSPHVFAVLFVQGCVSFLAGRMPSEAASPSHMYSPFFVVP